MSDDFDNYESDFEDFDIGMPDFDDRSPAGVAKQAIGKGISGIKAGSKSNIAKQVAEKLPNTNIIATEAGQLRNSISSMKNELFQDMEPTINTFKQIGRTLLAKTKRFLPEQLYSALSNKLTVYDLRSESEEERIVEYRDTTVKDTLASIFSAQEEKRNLEQDEERIDTYVDRKLDEIRHKDSITVFSSIDNSLLQQVAFQNNIYTAYLRKSLELKYDHLFVAKDTLALTKLLVKVSESKLEEIKHNTGLPDIQKQKFFESIKQSARSNIGSTFSSYMANFVPLLMENIKSNIFSPFTSQIKDLGMAMEMKMNMEESMSGFEPPESDVAKGTNLAGSWLGGKLADTHGGKLFRKHKEKLDDFDDYMSGFKERNIMRLHALKDTTDNSILKYLLNFLPDINVSTKVGTSFKDANEKSEFTNLTQTSIVEIIPGYLSKILKQVTDIATKSSDTELEVYNPITRDFSTVSKLRKSVVDKSIGTAQAIGESTKKVTKLLDENTTIDAEDYQEDIARTIINAANAKYPIIFKEIKDYVDTDVETDYISTIFKNIAHPRDVAFYILQATSNEMGKENKKLMAKINNNVTNQAKDEDYKQILATLVGDYGNQRYFKDFVTESNTLDVETIAKFQLQHMKDKRKEKEANISSEQIVPTTTNTNNISDIVNNEFITTNLLKEITYIKHSNIINDSLTTIIELLKQDNKESIDLNESNINNDSISEYNQDTYNNSISEYNQDTYNVEQVTPITTNTNNVKENISDIVNNKFITTNLLREIVTENLNKIFNTEYNQDTYNSEEEVNQYNRESNVFTEQLNQAITNSNNISDIVNNKSITTNLLKEITYIKHSNIINDSLTTIIELLKQDNKESIDLDKLNDISDNFFTLFKDTFNKSNTNINIDLSDQFKQLNENIGSIVNDNRNHMDLLIDKLCDTMDINNESEVNVYSNLLKEPTYIDHTTSMKDQLVTIIKLLEQGNLQTANLDKLADSFRDTLNSFSVSFKDTFNTFSSSFKDTFSKFSSNIDLSDQFKQLNEHIGSILSDNRNYMNSLFIRLSDIGSLDDKGIRDKFGTVGHGVYKGGKWVVDNSIKATGNIAKLSNELLTKGIGIGSKVLTKGIKTGTDIANIALPAFTNLSQLGLNLATDSMVNTIHSGKRIFRAMFGKHKHKQPFIDVYKKDNVDPGNPLLSANKQKEGVYFENGKQLKRSTDIDAPIFDIDNEIVLITQEDIDHGLVDINNESINIIIDFSKAKSKSKGLFKKGLGFITGVGGNMLDFYSQAISATFGFGKDALKISSDFTKSLLGLNKEDKSVTTWRTNVLDRLDTIVSLMPKELRGDIDSDGDVEGSYRDLQQKKKEALERKQDKDKTKQIEQQGGISTKAGIGLGALTSLFKKKDKEEDNDSGITDAVLGTGGTLLAGKVASKIGLKTLATRAATMGTGLLTSGAGIIGSGISGAASLAGAGLTATGTAAAGILAAIPVAGWIGLGVGALGVGAYMWYKSSHMSEESKVLLKDRCEFYRIPLTVKLKHIEKLEERTGEYLERKREAITKEELEHYAKKFKINIKDENKMSHFANWYQVRFVPIYAAYRSALMEMGVSEDIKGADILKEVRNRMGVILREISDKLPDISLENIIKGSDTKQQKEHDFLESSDKEIKAELSAMEKRKQLSDKRRKDAENLNKELEDKKKAQFIPVKGNAKAQHTSSATMDVDNVDIEKSTTNLQNTAEQNSQLDSLLKNVDTSKVYEAPPELTDKTQRWIKGHEGVRLHNYKDSLGKDTIGFGHLNLEGYTSLTMDQANALFNKDFVDHVGAAQTIPEFDILDPTRQAALIDLTYNMGPGSLIKFVNTRKYLREGQYAKAANNLLKSKYADQVHGRADEVAKVLATGNPDDIKPKDKINAGNGKTIPNLPSDKLSESSIAKIEDTIKPQSKEVWTSPTIKSDIPEQQDAIASADTSDNFVASPTVLTKDVPIPYMQPNITTDTLTKSITDDVAITNINTQNSNIKNITEQPIDIYGKEQSYKLDKVALGIDNLTKTMLNIFGNGEVFDAMNSNLQQLKEKEPVSIQQDNSSTTMIASAVQQAKSNITSSPVINIHKTQYQLG